VVGNERDLCFGLALTRGATGCALALAEDETPAVDGDAAVPLVVGTEITVLEAVRGAGAPGGRSGRRVAGRVPCAGSGRSPPCAGARCAATAATAAQPRRSVARPRIVSSPLTLRLPLFVAIDTPPAPRCQTLARRGSVESDDQHDHRDHGSQRDDHAVRDKHGVD
jgi:hypothetical protein